MKYHKSEAQHYAKKNMRGVWGATYTPYNRDLSVDYEAIRHNIRYLINDLQMEGVFLNGLQGEGYVQTAEERKRQFKIAVDEANGEMMVMPWTSDPNLETAIELTKYAEDIGADFVTIVLPKFYLNAASQEVVYQYFKQIADKVNIGILIHNHLGVGYGMSPETVARLAELPNIVAIKHGGSAAEIERTRRLCGNKIVVSKPSEEEWIFDRIAYGQEASIASPTPYVLQSKRSKLIKEYTDLVYRGEIAKAFEVYKKLQPLRDTYAKAAPSGRMQAVNKYWTQFLGMAGGDGRVRLTQPQLTEAEKQAIEKAVKSTELVEKPVGAVV